VRAGIFTFTAPRISSTVLKNLGMVRALAKRSISLGCAWWNGRALRRRLEGPSEDQNDEADRVLGADRHRCQSGVRRPRARASRRISSQGGSNDESNLLCLCAAHHLFGIHDERMRVSGTAPDKLIWEFGCAAAGRDSSPCCHRRR